MRNLGYSVPSVWMPDRRRLIRPPNFGDFQEFFYSAIEFLAFNESVGIPQNLAPDGVDLSVVLNNTMDWANELDGIGVSPAGTNDGVTVTHPQTRWDAGGTVTIAFRKTGPQSTFQRLFENDTFFIQPNGGEDGLDAKVDFVTFGPGSNAIAATWEDGEFHVITMGWPKNSDSGPYYFIFDGQMLSNETEAVQGNIDIASTVVLNNRPALDRAGGITSYLWLMTDGKQPPEFARAFNERIYDSMMESLFLPRPSDYLFFIPSAAGGVTRRYSLSLTGVG